jgi:hypothetical protein
LAVKSTATTTSHEKRRETESRRHGKESAVVETITLMAGGEVGITVEKDEDGVMMGEEATTDDVNVRTIDDIDTRRSK